MTANTAAAPLDANGKPVLSLMNDATGQVIPIHVGATVTGADGATYGKLDVNASVTATNPSVSADGSAIPLSSTLVGGSDGTNLQPLQVDASKYLKVNVAAGTGALETGGNLATLVTNTTGSATAANQATTHAWLATIVTNTTSIATDAHASSIVTNTANIPAKGTAVMTGSAPVTIATDDTQTTAIKNSVANIPAKGAAATAASTPVNIASDQVVPVKRSSVAAYTLASTTTSGSTQNSADITVGPYTEISIDINTTAQAGTSPTIQYFYERKGADGIYYVLWQSAVLTAAANTVSTSVGAGMAYNQSLGLTGRLRWVVGGTSTPTFTHSLNIYGK